MIIDLSCYPTKVIDSAWRHDGDPFTGERLLKMMDGPYYVNGKPRRIDKCFIQPPQGNTLHNFDNDHLDVAPLPGAQFADFNGNGWADVLARTASTGNL